MEGGESLPTELLDALHGYLEKSQLSFGSWNHKIGDTDYRVFFHESQSTTIPRTAG
jgi:hypothetical protein